MEAEKKEEDKVKKPPKKKKVGLSAAYLPIEPGLRIPYK